MMSPDSGFRLFRYPTSLGFIQYYLVGAFHPSAPCPICSTKPFVTPRHAVSIGLLLGTLSGDTVQELCEETGGNPHVANDVDADDRM